MDLPPPVVEAINRYTGGGYVEINCDCRGEAASDPQVLVDIVQLDKAVALSRTNFSQVLFRGIDGKLAMQLERSGISVGDILSFPGFLSTSRKLSVARRFVGYEIGGIILRILVPKGMLALDLARYSQVPDEEEILLPRDTKVQVLEYIEDGDVDVLSLEVVDHG